LASVIALQHQVTVVFICFTLLQAWESTYSKWQRLTYDLVNFAKEDSSSIDVQKYLRRRSGSKITIENMQVHELTFCAHLC